MGEFYIRVNGRPIDTYRHPQADYDQRYDGTYVEGRKGKPYTLTYWNRTNKRQKIVVSVDGLNVMTGDSTWDRGYVVPPNDYIDIPGWRKDANNVAAFEFSSVKGSYNQHNDSGDKNNVGVIGCKVYNEVVKPVVYKEEVQHIWHHHSPFVAPYNPWVWQPYIDWKQPHYTVNYQPSNYTQVVGQNSMQTSATCSQNSTSSPLRAANFVGMAQSTEPQMELEPQSLGTGWGKNTEFKTTSVYAEWESNPIETHIIYYDDRRGLQRRGIELRPVREHRLPNAFPDGCPAPKYSRVGLSNKY